MSTGTSPQSKIDLPIDASQIDQSEVPFRPFPDVQGKGAGGFQVVFKRSVLNEIARHGLSSPGVEVCGVVVGNVYRDESGPFLYVDASVRGNGAESAGTSVTFKADTWTHIQTIMERDHESRRVVGWYHTHPSFGIFLSDMDVFICKNFFELPWQIAYVFDPVSGEAGAFVWRGGVPVSEKLLVEEDEKPVPLPSQKGTSGPSSIGADVLQRLSKIEHTQRSLMAVLGLVLIVAIGWPVLLASFRREQSMDHWLAPADTPARDVLTIPSLEGVTLPTTRPAR